MVFSKGVAALALFASYAKAFQVQFSADANQVEACAIMIEVFDRTGNGGFIPVDNVNVQVMDDGVFQATCQPTKFFIVNQNSVVPGFIDDIVNTYVGPVTIDFQGGDDFAAFAQGILNVVNGVIAFDANDFVGGAEGDLRNLAAASTADFDQAKAPGVFCVDDIQCVGVRLQNRAKDLAVRTCLNNDDDLLDDPNVVRRCEDFAAHFNLRWLLFFIMASYGILILWALYWTIPYLRKKMKGKKQSSRAAAKPAMNPQDQVLVNTLAAQCAASENMLLMATDFVKQAKGMASVLSVEAKRESRIMIYVCEYFQVVASIVVALTHEYLQNKTFVEGEKFNMEDATTRALQLEVLNYVRTRIQLSFNSDSMTEKSLIRLAEAYAILKKVSESLVFVGFTLDRQFEDSLGSLRTPNVEFTENAFFLGGIWKSNNNAPGMNQYENSPVCVTINGADTRGLQRIGANLYLTNSQKDAKNYNPTMMMTENKVGKSLSFQSVNAGQTGEGSQYFVRTFWGPEIAAMQAESRKWVNSEGALEDFLDKERVERESKAQPMVKQVSGPKKKRRRKKKKKNQEYTEANDEATEYTDATSETGWSVDESNTYVYNVQSVAAHGLGIAGKPNIPYDKPNESVKSRSSKAYQLFESYFPNYAEWPKFYTFFFVIMPAIILIPWIARAGQGSEKIDQDGNVGFKARAAGFGFSYLGVPGYYFLDAFVPEADDLVILDTVGEDDIIGVDLDNIQAALGIDLDAYNPFGTDNGQIFISNGQALDFFRKDWNGASGRRPDQFLGELQAGILVQTDVEGLDSIRRQQKAQEVTTVFVYGLMHIGAYFFGMVPLTLVRESLEILARRFSVIREIYPMSQWRELHMAMGLGGILFVVFGATVFLITQLVAIEKGTPFAGLGGDPNIPVFFNFTDNVLYIRQVLLPAVPLLLLMKYASRGPPRIVRKYAPRWITMNYWEICYFLHYFTALTAIIVLVIYRAQVFYWMGATWGFVWGGNKVVRILRTRRATIKNADLVSYTVEDTRNNAKKRSDVLRITLNIPSSFPSSARGQACWITCPEIDYVAHPFTLAKTPTETEKVISFHIAIRYLPGDDIMSFAKPDSAPAPKQAAPAPADPNALPPGWKSAVDPTSGQTYYYNSAEQRTTWTQPKASGADAFFDGVRGITSRLSANFLRGNSSARFGPDIVKDKDYDPANTRQFVVRERATWTQKFASLARKLQNLDPQLRANAMKNHPIYVSAPLGTSMDDAIKPDVPGSIIITTQNGLPAAESSVRWLLQQPRHKRPVFHFFVSVVREVNDALAVCEMLRDSMVDSVNRGHLNIDGLSGKHAHMCDWLGIYLHLTRRKGKTIAGDREMLFRALNPPKQQIDERKLAIIDEFIKNRIMPGRLPFDRFLQRTQQMVRKRAGDDRMAVAYCGSYKVANSLRSACRKLKNVKFDGEYI